MRDNILTAIVVLVTVFSIVYMIGYAIDQGQREWEVNNGRWTEVVR